MVNARIFQIFYDESSRAQLDPAFEALDNSSNKRPDWYEYWPIKNYLAFNALDDSTYYGFLSPKFGSKTTLSGSQVKEFVDRANGADVITFSQYPCLAASFFNMF